MMAVNVAGWPGSTLRSSEDTWTEGGAEQEIRSLSGNTKFDHSHILMYSPKTRIPSVISCIGSAI